MAPKKSGLQRLFNVREKRLFDKVVRELELDKVETAILKIKMMKSPPITSLVKVIELLPEELQARYYSKLE